MQKPYESYAGGKGATGVHQTIINEIPPHTFYAELFLGNGTIFRKKKPSFFTLLSDLSDTVVNEWETLGITKIEILDHFDFFTNATAPQIIKSSGIDLLLEKDHCGFYELDVENAFIFLDPPYPFFVRKDQTPCYDHELTDNDHITLLGVISSYQNAKIMISSYPNEMYDSALSTWRKRDFVSQTRRGKVKERIYMNYPEPQELHDYSFVGANFRDRWRIRKKVVNIVEKLKRLPPLERNAILEAVKTELIELK